MLELVVNDKTYQVSEGHRYASFSSIQTHQVFYEDQLIWSLVHYSDQHRFALQGYQRRYELKAQTFEDAVQEMCKYL